MARYIDADSLDIITITTDDYSGNEILDVILKEDIDNAQPVDVISKEQIDEMIAEIHLWLKQHYCFAEEGVMNIIHKYCDKENEDGRIS